MGVFGWSYPPGCSGPPDDDEGPCAVCGQSYDNCICPECPECGEQGNPCCYVSLGDFHCDMIGSECHGLIMSLEQIIGAMNTEMKLEEDNKAEALYWQQFKKQNGDFEDGAY